MNDQSTPKYATLLYEVRKQLDISWMEYVYLDMVYHLSHDGWCYKSLDNVAEDLGIDRSNVYRMRNRLIEKKLLIHSGGSKVKTSVIYAKCIQTVNPRMRNATQPYAKRDKSVVKTHTKNNNRNTIELEIKNKGNGTTDNRGIASPAKERLRAMLKQKQLL